MIDRIGINEAPTQINTNDKAFYMMGWNDAVVAMQKETAANSEKQINSENVYTNAKGVVYDAVGSDGSCYGCDFKDFDCFAPDLECRRKARLDGRSIIWVKRN